LNLEVQHYSRYDYSAEVVLGQHVFRLKPATNANQRLLTFQLDIAPDPSGRSEIVDLDYNEAMAAWFTGSTGFLALTATSVVETLRPNPFDYLWQGDRMLPLAYSPALREALAPYGQPAASEPVRRLAAEVGARAARDAAAFLPALAAALHDRIAYIERLEGPPLAPSETLSRGEGSCRDLAVLFLAAARYQGFAGRFVSGYHAATGSITFELHAWAEVYVPGGGWRGFDPSTGFAVADRHIALAFGSRPEQTSPVSGTFSGSASSRLETRVEIRELTAAR
jgi:transglutaminase-like putative cysteine protease